MQSSPNSTVSPRPRRQWEVEAYSAAQDGVLHVLRSKEADDDVTSYADLAARAGFDVEETEDATRKLIKRGLVFWAPLSDDGLRSPMVLKARRVEQSE